MHQRFLLLSLTVAAALGIAGVVAGPPPEPGQKPSTPIQLPADGFSSSNACQACHPSQYASWHASYHRTMTQVATPRTAIPRFANEVVTATQGRPMLLQQRGDRLFATFDDPDSPAPVAERPRIERQVTLITGSHNQQVFWYATGNTRMLGQLPAAYLVNEQRWIPRRMAVLHPPIQQPLSETGHWNSTCIACHATQGKPQLDTPFGTRPVQEQSAQTTAVEFGIACEACHGPGETHVAANQNLLRRYRLHFTAAPDPTTVQPRRLNPRIGSQVCGQCHSVWEFSDESAERAANSGGLPFRPGEELAASRFVAQPTRNGDSPTMKMLLADDSRFIRDAFWPDGMVRVSGREYNGLLESPCYRDATAPERTLSCFSCHSLHKADDDSRPLREWANDQLTSRKSPAGSVGDSTENNEACLQCHGRMRNDVASHSHHATESAGSLCYNCHMPYTTYGLLKTIRSHTISSPTVRESVASSRPNACNLCHLDRTLAWTQDALQRWYDTQPVALGDDERTVAASLLWLLKGDAGQRAIVSQAMAWGPAQQASGVEWMAPYLAQLLDDPYDAVRLGAARSLRALPGFAQVSVDVIGPPATRRRAQLQVMATWDGVRRRPAQASPAVLLDASGNVDIPRVLALLKQRDNRPMLLRE